MEFQLIGIASDHAGVELKQMIVEFLTLLDLVIVDHGVSLKDTHSVDYPDYARSLAESIQEGKVQGGIALCGTGIGMSIAANKFPGIRAGVVWDEFSCRMSRSHNDANILCLGSRALHPHRAVELVKLWLETPFSGARHGVRLEKITHIERTVCGKGHGAHQVLG
jgi:ribose 5-phosphate isomerase B